jgi:hypothetical protein
MRCLNSLNNGDQSEQLAMPNMLITPFAPNRKVRNTPPSNFKYRQHHNLHVQIAAIRMKQLDSTTTEVGSTTSTVQRLEQWNEPSGMVLVTKPTSTAAIWRVHQY